MADERETASIERRSHARRSASIKAELNGQPVTVLDISLGGIGGTVELHGNIQSIPLPGEAATVVLDPEGEAPVALTVELRRVGESLNRFGARIVELSAEQAQAVERLCGARSDVKP